MNYENEIKEIVDLLYENKLIDTWYRSNPDGWTSSLGVWSPLAIDLRPISSFPTILQKIGNLMAKVIKEEKEPITNLIGIAYSGIPIAISASLASGIPAGFTRKIESSTTLIQLEASLARSGKHQIVEGFIKDGANIAIIDDIVFKFGNEEIALKQIQRTIEKKGIKAKCSNLFVLIDREHGADKEAEKFHLKLTALIPFKSKGMKYLKEKISKIEYDVISEFLEHPEIFQTKEKQKIVKDLCKK